MNAAEEKLKLLLKKMDALQAQIKRIMQGHPTQADQHMDLGELVLEKVRLELKIDEAIEK